MAEGNESAIMTESDDIGASRSDESSYGSDESSYRSDSDGSDTAVDSDESVRRTDSDPSVKNPDSDVSGTTTEVASLAPDSPKFSSGCTTLTPSGTGNFPSMKAQQYRNSLLAAIGYLDFTNALDYPANVWNQYPIPLYATILMAIGGPIAILSTGFGFWDVRRCWRNVKILRAERRFLKSIQKRSCVEDAMIDVNTRELGWEVIDRILLDLFMATGGIMVGTGCILAIWGIHPQIYLASAIMSGYLGNSFVAAYAVINTFWAIFMYKKASDSEKATAQFKDNMDARVLNSLSRHYYRHKFYACVNGITIFISGIGSEVSSTLWQGYVVLIPCVIGSIFCNYYWRHYCGYDRTACHYRSVDSGFDVLERLRVVSVLEDELAKDSSSITLFIAAAPTLTIEDRARWFLQDFGCVADFDAELVKELKTLPKSLPSTPGSFPDTPLDNEAVLVHAQRVIRAATTCVRRLGAKRFAHEERYLSELYGYYLEKKELKKASIDEESSSSDVEK